MSDKNWIKVSMLLRKVMESMGKVDDNVNTGHPMNHSVVSSIKVQVKRN